MSKEYTIIVHDIAEDGLPPPDLEKAGLVGRVVFIFDGSLFSGWPVHDNNREDGDEVVWEDSETAQCFYGIKKWIELPKAGWAL